MDDEYSNLRIAMRVVGLTLLIIGIVLVITGMATFRGAGFPVFPIGAFMLVIGFGLTSWSFMRQYTRFVATEISPAMRVTGKSLAEGMKEADFNPQQQIKTVVKVKCKYCGYLETEDAEFCSKCGKKI